MKDLEKEYPILKKDRHYRRTKRKNLSNLLDFINAVFSIILRIFIR